MMSKFYVHLFPDVPRPIKVFCVGVELAWPDLTFFSYVEEIVSIGIFFHDTSRSPTISVCGNPGMIPLQRALVVALSDRKHFIHNNKKKIKSYSMQKSALH